MAAGRAASTSATKMAAGSGSTSWARPARRSPTRLAALMRAHEEKRPIPSQREKVGPFLRRWLDEVARPTLRASTYDSYDDILGRTSSPGWAHRSREAHAGRGPGVPQPEARRRAVARRVQYVHAVLRRALGTAERWGMVSRNVAKLVDPPRVPKHEIRPLTPEQASGSSRPRRLTGSGRSTSPRSARVCARASCWASAGRTSTSKPGGCGSATRLPTSAAP